MTTNIHLLDSASTFYSDIYLDVLQGNKATSDQWKKFCLEVSEQGTAFEIDLLQGFSFPEEWTGSRTVGSLRAAKKVIRTKDYQVSKRVSKLSLKQQPELVGRGLRNWVAGQTNFINSMVFQKLILGNSEVQTDIDNVAFFSTAHPMDDGTTQSNYTTSALNSTTYRAAAAAMRKYKDRSGMPLGVRPAFLMVGPDNEYVSRDLLVAKSRTQGITAAGLLDQSSGNVAAGSIENTISLDGVEIIVNPFLVGTYANYWFLIGDLNGAKPMVVNIAEAFHPVDNTNQFVDVPEYTFGIEGQYGIDFGIWQTCYGGFV